MKNTDIKKLDYLYENSLNGIAAIFILSIVVFFTFDGFVDYQNLVIWFSLNTLLFLSRTFSLYLYKSIKIDLTNYMKFYKLFFAFTLLNAFLWGSSAFFIFPIEIEFQMILLILIAGILSGSAIVLSVYTEMFYSSLFLSMFPFIYKLNLNNTYASDVLVISLFIYVITLIVISKKISFTLNSNITLAHENHDLILQLKEKVKESNVANQAKSDFLSVMSHEIRTPLNAIIGFVQILKRTETDSKKIGYLAIIDRSSKVLTNVINDILDISKIESGKINLERIAFHPQSEFLSVFSLFEQSANEQGTVLINFISPTLPKTVKSDILRIKQILSNLLSNAIKFTPQGKNIKFIVKFNKDKSSLYFEIKDSGIGISAENIENITQVFTQADNSTARKYGGSGLGLSIVTKFLKLFDSELKIESKLGQGSKFSFEIKVDVVTDSIEIDNEDNQIDALDFSEKKILIAEDNKTNQMLVELILDDMDIEVAIANDGVEALEMFKKDKFDMVLMDINMPNKNGIEAMIDIKDYEQSLKTPIIALTANAVSGDKEKYLDLGFDDYIAKPIENEELVRVLQKYFD